MPEQVKVDDFEVFRLFRAALLKFAQTADNSLAGADSQISGMHAWLENEQGTYWQSQLRKRMEMVAQAREEVRKKKLYKDSTGRTPGAVEEEKVLAKRMAAVAEAEQKILAVRKWLPRLEKASELYRSGTARLVGDLSGEIPRAVNLLDRLAARLEEYVQIEGPREVGSEAGIVLTGETMSRGESFGAAEVVEGKKAEEKKEGADVVDGQ
jgi:hypothetical protein